LLPFPFELNPITSPGDVEDAPSSGVCAMNWLCLRGFFGAIALGLFASSAHSQATTLSFEVLACASFHELESLYRQAAPGTMPTGFVRGRTVYCSHDFLAGSRARIANFFWKGKHFCDQDSSLINQFLGVRAIRAHTYPGTSSLDGQPAWILDYAHTSLLWKDVRDEMREVAPGLYVGAMYERRCPEPHLKLFFVLEAGSCCR
jgi:hypothetical protein